MLLTDFFVFVFTFNDFSKDLETQHGLFMGGFLLAFWVDHADQGLGDFWEIDSGESFEFFKGFCLDVGDGSDEVVELEIALLLELLRFFKSMDSSNQ